MSAIYRLHRIADIYERHLPRSLGMQAYSAWSSEFNKDVPATPGTLTAAVIITGPGDTARTKASLRTCAGNIRCFDGEPFPALLAAAIAARCDVLACVRAGDTVAPGSFSYIEEAFAVPGAQIVYTDSEYEGKPWFKPAWNHDYALATDYPLELMLVRTGAVDTAAASPAALAWSALSRYWTDSEAVIHVPRALYRFHTPLDNAERTLRDAAASAALAAHEPSTTLTALAASSSSPCAAARRVRPSLSSEAKQLHVSLIIPTRDRVELLQRCITTITQHTDWPQLEIIVIDNGSIEEKTARYFEQITASGIRVLPMPGPFNYADLNNRAVALATGEVIGLINNDIEALHDGWLDEIVAQLMRPNVGVVGAKLLWPNGMVQHGGVLLGVGNVAGHFGNRLADADWGDHGRNQLVQQVSAVTAACLFLRKSDFEAVGGMDAAAFPVAFNDVDLCLKIRASGKFIVWTPHAKLLHAESASRGHEDTPQKRARSQREIDILRQRWGAVLLRDPAYHPSLNLDPNSHAFGGLALPPRSRTPRTGAFVTEENQQ
jgi:O-antigen biosynthesis protein